VSGIVRMEESGSAVLELLVVALEAHCAGLPPKERVLFLKRMEDVFAYRERVAPLVRGQSGAAVRCSHNAFRHALPRLLAP